MTILVHFSRNLTLYKRNDNHYVKDLTKDKQIKHYHINGKKNPTDILAKIEDTLSLSTSVLLLNS